VDFALGTDAAGSVRIPAAMTGTVGFKPTTGLVSKLGVMRGASATSIDNVGIVARRVSTVESVLGVIRTPDPGDPQTLIGNQCDISVTSRAELALDRLRIGTLGNRTLDKLNSIYSMEKDVALAFRSSCDRIKELGAVLVEIDPTGWESAIPTIVTLFSSELAEAHRHLLAPNRHRYHPDVGAMLEESLRITEDTLRKVVSSRAALALALNHDMAAAAIDFLLTPVTPRPAMSLDLFKPAHELASLIPFTCVCNLTGLPAISLPHGFTTTGLPLGLQIIGRRFADDSVLLFAKELEKELVIHAGPFDLQAEFES
jgi:aspartyl-tRNA(Asn)/glutamyl-tRNA(Gln) amidotransferase subunit A